jgi:hypothetical protein
MGNLVKAVALAALSAQLSAGISLNVSDRGMDSSSQLNIKADENAQLP